MVRNQSFYAGNWIAVLYIISPSLFQRGFLHYCGRSLPAKTSSVKVLSKGGKIHTRNRYDDFSHSLHVKGSIVDNRHYSVTIHVWIRFWSVPYIARPWNTNNDRQIQRRECTTLYFLLSGRERGKFEAPKWVLRILISSAAKTETSFSIVNLQLSFRF